MLFFVNIPLCQSSIGLWQSLISMPLSPLWFWWPLLRLLLYLIRMQSAPFPPPRQASSQRHHFQLFSRHSKSTETLNEKRPNERSRERWESDKNREWGNREIGWSQLSRRSSRREGKERRRRKKERKWKNEEGDGRRAEDRDCFTACSCLCLCLCHCDVPSDALKHGHSILSCRNDWR